MKQLFILFVILSLFLTACSEKKTEAYVNKIGGNTAENITINGTNSYIVQRNITIDTRYVVDDAYIVIRGIT